MALRVIPHPLAEVDTKSKLDPFQISFPVLFMHTVQYTCLMMRILPQSFAEWTVSNVFALRLHLLANQKESASSQFKLP